MTCKEVLHNPVTVSTEDPDTASPASTLPITECDAEPPGSEATAEVDKSKYETLLETAVAMGAFNLKNGVGVAWQKAKAADAQLRAEYECVGKSFAKQWEFTAKWAARELQRERTGKNHTQSSAKVEEELGTYHPLLKIAAEEGGGFCGLQAACHCVRTCVNMSKKGGESGLKFCRWNDWTKLAEI